MLAAILLAAILCSSTAMSKSKVQMETFNYYKYSLLGKNMKESGIGLGIGLGIDI